MKFHLEKIKKTFEEYFTIINCRSEMVIHLPERVEEAAIRLKVSFRKEEPLQVLAATTQVCLLPPPAVSPILPVHV